MKKQLREKGSTSHEYWIYPSSHTLLEIALYYGFTPISPIHTEKTEKLEEIPLYSEEIVSVLKNHFAKGMSQLPLTLVRERKLEKKDTSKRFECCLDVVGTSRSIADALTIKTAYEMIREEYGNNVFIEINSIGDKESLARFNRELTNYFRKNITELDPECRQALKKSAFAAIACQHEKCQEIKRSAPHPMSYLSEVSRSHFKEVLEHLEMAELPYTINTKLVQYQDFASHTLFKIFVQEEGNPQPMLVASGARWAGLAKKIGFKRDVQGVTAVISLKKSVEPKSSKKIAKPKCYFIQMGQEAKMRSLSLIETLRKAHIPVYHSLSKDKLTAQLSSAENLKVPFVLIMGQKESMENTVLVREMYNRSQETIRIDMVADYLKKLIK
ncbi:MAG: His/Gly/Thr/Pro-type tRNA ligase C-terminal domain-containing protein [bacterium]|nr:His/Gly/Thr/Pro-type tRNA ligase C-terminal domain-containing protein [bacterium]